MKKCFVVLLAVILAGVLCSCAAAVEYGAAGYETEGYDEAHAWEISSAATLEQVRDDVNSKKSVIKSGSCFKFTQDIDLSSPAYSDWKPINVTAAQNLTFDGGNHTITVAINRTINHQSQVATHAGLFGTFGNGTIKNLSVTGSIRFTGDSRSYFLQECVGGIVGQLSKGTVENCSFNGTIYGYNGGGTIVAGGIAGDAGEAMEDTEVTIRNCKVGNVSSTKISASINHPASVLASYAGGIVGRFWNKTNTSSKIIGNYSCATLEAENTGLIYGKREGTRGTVSDNTEVDPNESDTPTTDTPTTDTPTTDTPTTVPTSGGGGGGCNSGFGVIILAALVLKRSR